MNLEEDQMFYKLIDQSSDAHEIKELIKFLYKNKIRWDKKKNDWSKPFHNVLGTRWVKSNKGSFNKEMDQKGYLENYFVRWKLGQDTHRLTKCAYCFTELKKKQRKYCGDKCRVLAKYIRDKREKLKAEVIWHSEKRISGHRVFPQWKDFTVIYADGRIEPLTQKNGKLQ